MEEDVDTDVQDMDIHEGGLMDPEPATTIKTSPEKGLFSNLIISRFTCRQANWQPLCRNCTNPKAHRACVFKGSKKKKKDITCRKTNRQPPCVNCTNPSAHRRCIFSQITRAPTSMADTTTLMGLEPLSPSPLKAQAKFPSPENIKYKNPALSFWEKPRSKILGMHL